MMDEIKEIEEIINKLDNVTPEEWNKREDETVEEFEERIQEIEEDIEDELIDAISDSLLNEQEINEEEAVKEAREKIDKEYKLYEDAFEKDDNGKLALKDSEELAKLGYESKEEIEKLNTIMNNYNNPDQYIEDIRNSIKAKKDIDAEIERKVEIAKTYISAKIRGEEPVIPSNEEKVKKYEDNNNYITTTRYLKRVPAVQSEYIYTNRIISQNYIPYVPINSKVVTSGVGTATQIVSRPVVRPKTSVSNPTKVKVLRNLETKMDKTNNLTKQKIQARTELKRVFKEFQDKDLTEDEVTDLQDKIAKIEKKYPNIVNEKTLSNLYKDFNVVVPEKEQEKEVIKENKEEEQTKNEEQEVETEKLEKEKLKVNVETEKIEKKINDQLNNITKEETTESLVTPIIPEDSKITKELKQREEKKKKQVKSTKRSILGIKGKIKKITEESKKKDKERAEKTEKIKIEKKKAEKKDDKKIKITPIIIPHVEKEQQQLNNEVKKELKEKKQEIGKIKIETDKEQKKTEEVAKVSEEIKEKAEEVKYISEEEKNKGQGLFKKIMQFTHLEKERPRAEENETASDAMTKISEAVREIKHFEKQKEINISDINFAYLNNVALYLEDNNDSKVRKTYKRIIKKVEDFTGDKFIENLENFNGHFDIKLLERMHTLHTYGVKGKDGSIIVEKDSKKAREYLNREYIYLEYLRSELKDKNNNPIINIKNEARFNKTIPLTDEISVVKKIDGMKLMLKSEALKRNDNVSNRQSYENEIQMYDEKIKKGEKVGKYALSILGDIYYDGIQIADNKFIVEPNKLKAKKVYEKMIQDYPKFEDKTAYNRLFTLYNDKTLPFYDKNKADKLAEIMKQNGIGLDDYSKRQEKQEEIIKCSYVCSDLHGEYEVYKEIMDRVGENGKLYILGDAIDRGSNGIKILQDVMKRQEKGQVEFFMGNHEYMMLRSILEPEKKEELWDYNDKETHEAYEKLPSKEQEKMKDFLMDALVYKQIEERGQEYYLVHARAIQNTNKKSQTYRELKNSNVDNKLIVSALSDSLGYDCDEKDIAKEGIFTIIGHTPTFHNENQIELHNGYIDIDCGVSYGGKASLVNLTTGDVEYFSVEKIKEKNSKETDKEK